MERFFLVVKEKKVQQNEEQRRSKGGATHTHTHTLSLSLSLSLTTSKLFFLRAENKQTDTQKKNNTTGAEQSKGMFQVQSPNSKPVLAKYCLYYIILYYIIFT